MNKTTHYWEPLTEDNSPRDEGMDGSSLTFEALEHDQHCCPRAIRVTDKEGRSLTYAPIEYDGKPVKSHHFYYMDDVNIDRCVEDDRREMREASPVMSTPEDLQLPQAERAAVFRAMVQIIGNDPIVRPTLRTFLAWTGGLDDSVTLALGMAPALRITPTGGGDVWSSPNTHKGYVYLNCEILTAGFNVDNPTNLWRAIIAAFYDPQGTTFTAIQTTLRLAGAYPPSPEFTMPAFDPKPEGNYCWGIAQIRIMVQTQLGSRGAPA